MDVDWWPTDMRYHFVRRFVIMTKRKRILTGDRPTGKLHLGHYVGWPHPSQSIISSQRDSKTEGTTLAWFALEPHLAVM